MVRGWVVQLESHWKAMSGQRRVLHAAMTLSQTWTHCACSTHRVCAFVTLSCHVESNNSGLVELRRLLDKPCTCRPRNEHASVAGILGARLTPTTHCFRVQWLLAQTALHALLCCRCLATTTRCCIQDSSLRQTASWWRMQWPSLGSLAPLALQRGRVEDYASKYIYIF